MIEPIALAAELRAAYAARRLVPAPSSRDVVILREVHASRVRRWVEDKQAVEAHERAESCSAAASARETVSQALALVALYGRLHGWPAAEDDVSCREDEQMYERWHRLRTALRRAR